MEGCLDASRQQREERTCGKSQVQRPVARGSLARMRDGKKAIVFDDLSKGGVWQEMSLQKGHRGPVKDLVGLYPKHSGEPWKGFKLGFLS